MLVLGRKNNESIWIYTRDGAIRVRLWDCRQGEAKLVFDAPPGVKIIREELLEKEEQP